MTSEIQILKDFVEGKLSPKAFEQHIYTNSALEELLSDPAISWHGTYLEGTTTFLYLAELNYGNSAGQIEAHGTAELFLMKIGIEVIASKKYMQDHELLISATPKYIDADADFIEKYILPTDKMIAKADKKQFIKQRYAELFKYQTKPPQWIQHPDWLIKNDKPLFFLGQFEIKNCNLFNDDGCIYLFIDTGTGAVETVKQFY
ncbi:hypothetical protein [Pedobacter cryoconitis]|uniref:hypothetical protein n=1 Tax=Pedobacter cryoconitis TaxID=188932 RepID=UPI0016126C6C|nr:hypothetical protein [Pedobacter cryoconitis]MBB5646121.1 hypothetical protein [Pedobacter cryoconitis]